MPGSTREIVFVVNAAIVGGAERHTEALAKGLSLRGFPTRIFALNPNGVSAKVSIARQVRDLKAFLRARESGLVVAVNERPALVAALAGVRRMASLACILHSTLPRNRWERVLRLAHLPALFHPDRVIFVSERQRAHWRRCGLVRTSHMIRNGVDVRRFTPALDPSRRAALRAELGFAREDVVASFCAVLRPEKNPAHFLEALAGLRRAGAPIKGLVIGDGPCAQAMHEQIAGKLLGDAVTMAGLCADVRPYLQAADFGVNCSVAIETMSLSALETLAMGVPMVMSDIGGASEIVDGENGVLFRAGDARALQSAMAQMLSTERRKRAGLAARARAVNEFDEAVMIDRYVDLFADMMRN